MRTQVKVTAAKDGSLTISDAMKPQVSERRIYCRACGEGALERVLDLGEQYLVGFVAGFDPELPKAPLTLVRCPRCGLLQLNDTVDHERLFRTYWYRSSVNASMRAALDDLVSEATRYHQSGVWLDIGANDGYTLSRTPDSFRRIACEPAHAFTEDLHKVADHVIPDFFSAEHEVLRNGREGACDVITSAAMFYDVDDPGAFVADIVRCLAPGGVWINQLNDSPTMLRKNAFDSICHEHLCYYDVRTLDTLYKQHGLAIVGISYNDVNGGSIRIAAMRSGGDVRGISLAGHPSVTAQQAQDFASRVMKWRATMLDLVHGPLQIGGRPWLYGASTKGSVLLQLLGCEDVFAGIADRNPAKHGLVLAGSNLTIYPEEEMREQQPRFLMALPWAFRDEFVKRERGLLDSGTTMVFPLPEIEFVS